MQRLNVTLQGPAKVHKALIDFGGGSDRGRWSRKEDNAFD